MNTFHSLLSCSLLLGALSAQDATYRFVPADYDLVIRVSGPAKWRTAFAGTPAARLLESPAFAPMLTMIEQGREAWREELKSQGKAEAMQILDGMLNNYAGEIVIGVDVELDNIMEAVMNDEPPPFAMVISVGPDGDSDLTKLAAEIVKNMEGKNEEFTASEQTIGSHSLRLFVNEDKIGFVEPTVIDGHLVTVFGTDLERKVADVIGDKPRYQGGNAVGTLQVSASMQKLVQMLQVGMEFAGDAPFDVDGLIGAFGFKSMDRMELSFGAEDKRVTMDTMMSFTTGERGVFDVMFSRGTKPQKALALVPHGASDFSAMAMDFSRIHGVIKGVMASMEDVLPITFDEAMERFQQTTGVRLKEDLLDQLGGEMLMVNLVEEGFGADEQTVCFAIPLRNGKAFEDALERALKSVNATAGRKSEEYQSVQVHRMALGGLVALEYATAPDVLLIAFGKSGGEQLRAVLDQRAAKSGELAPAVKGAMAAANTEAWTALAAASLSSSLGMVANGVEQASQFGGEPELEAVAPMLRGLIKELKRLGIDRMFSWSITDGSAIRSRAVWANK